MDTTDARLDIRVAKFELAAEDHLESIQATLRRLELADQHAQQRHDDAQALYNRRHEEAVKLHQEAQREYNQRHAESQKEYNQRHAESQQEFNRRFDAFQESFKQSIAESLRRMDDNFKEGRAEMLASRKESQLHFRWVVGIQMTTLFAMIGILARAVKVF